MGFVITGYANLMILGEIPSYPVAFLIFNLFICLVVIDLHLEIDSDGRLRTKIYDKRDYFNFPIVNFSFICSNIPTAHASCICSVYLPVDRIFQSL